ncbi:hypothetical protein THAOC_07395, partial [Thalassiosira oceanica]
MTAHTRPGLQDTNVTTERRTRARLNQTAHNKGEKDDPNNLDRPHGRHLRLLRRRGGVPPRLQRRHDLQIRRHRLGHLDRRDDDLVHVLGRVLSQPQQPDDRLRGNHHDDREAQLLLRGRPEQRVLQHVRLRAGGAVLEPSLDEGIGSVLGEKGVATITAAPILAAWQTDSGCPDAYVSGKAYGPDDTVSVGGPPVAVAAGGGPPVS